MQVHALRLKSQHVSIDLERAGNTAWNHALLSKLTNGVDRTNSSGHDDHGDDHGDDHVRLAAFQAGNAARTE